MGLVPQKDDDAMKIYSWRWKSVCLGVVSAIIATYAASWLPFVKPPYAMASALTDTKTDLQHELDTTNIQVAKINQQLAVVIVGQKSGQIRSLNNDLIDARRYQCRGEAAGGDRATLAFWGQRLQTLKLAYQDLAGEAWPDMDCKSF